MARPGNVSIGPAGARGEVDEALWAKKTFEALGARFIGSRRNSAAPAYLTLQYGHRVGGNDDEFTITHVESGLSTDTMLQLGLMKYPPKISNLFVSAVRFMDFIMENYTPNTVEDTRPTALAVKAVRSAALEKAQEKPELYVKAKTEK